MRILVEEFTFPAWETKEVNPASYILYRQGDFVLYPGSQRLNILTFYR